MKRSEVDQVLAYLSAAFRTPLEPATVAIYVSELLPLDAVDAAEAGRWIVRNSRFFPAIADLLDAAEDARRMRIDRERALRPAIEAETTWTEADERAARKAMRSVLAEWRRRHPRTRRHRVLGRPTDLSFNEAEVEAKREAARQAAAALARITHASGEGADKAGRTGRKGAGG